MGNIDQRPILARPASSTLVRMEFHPEALSLRNRYKLLIGAIVPRPIALVSTVSAEGTTNLAPIKSL